MVLVDVVRDGAMKLHLKRQERWRAFRSGSQQMTTENTNDERNIPKPMDIVGHSLRQLFANDVEFSC